MAKIDGLIPFILYFEAGLPRGMMTLPAEKIYARAVRTGFANDPDDRGGLTMCGVTYATYSHFCGLRRRTPSLVEFRNMDFSTWRSILKTLYWDAWHADEIFSQPVADLLVDWVWASGTVGIKWPQRVLGVSADGIVGPKTVAAVNIADPGELFAKLHEDRLAFVEGIVHHNPSQAKFLRGWERRINDITYGGLRYL